MFIVVEGIEGSGKSTLVAGLADALRAEGRDVVVTREPGGTEIGNALRDIFLSPALTMTPLTESLLVNAARAQHVAEVIRPALDAERVVLCDRFVDSTLTYQGYGRGLDLKKLRVLCEMATGGLEPDLVLLVDVPVSVTRSRLIERVQNSDRIEDRIEREDDGFHERVRRGFLELATSPRHRVLDGELPQRELLQRALGDIADLMPAASKAQRTLRRRKRHE
jgi:dTMP kinase